MRKLPFIILFLAVAFAFASFVKADTLSLDSGNVNDGTFFVGSVNMSLNGSHLEAMCVSISLESQFGTNWSVKSFNLGGDLSGFSLYSGTADSFRILQEVGFLYSETKLVGATTAQISAENRAAWILTKSPSDTSHDSYLFDPQSIAALQNAQNQTFTAAFNNSITFYQPTDSANQIFVTQGIPEPSTIAFVAFAGLVGFGFWRRAATN